MHTFLLIVLFEDVVESQIGVPEMYIQFQYHCRRIRPWNPKNQAYQGVTNRDRPWLVYFVPLKMRSLSDSSVTTRDEFEFGIVGFVVFGFCGFVVFGFWYDLVFWGRTSQGEVGEPQKTQPQMLAYRANFRSSGIGGAKNRSRGAQRSDWPAIHIANGWKTGECAEPPRPEHQDLKAYLAEMVAKSGGKYGNGWTW